MLDTNICIYLMKNQPPVIAERLDQCYIGDVVISAITFAELEYGALISTNPLAHRRNLASIIQSIPVIAFDAGAAIAYAPIRQATHNRKRDQFRQTDRCACNSTKRHARDEHQRLRRIPWCADRKLAGR
jgi:tRNA(fMet)-specific endonuclease VapC